MKQVLKSKWVIASLLMIFVGTTATAQTLKDFFNNKGTPLTYLGIDYYKNRMINNPGGNPTDIKMRLYASMNDVVITEMAKYYNITKAFDRDNEVSTDIAPVTARNEKVEIKDITSSNDADFSRLTQPDIEAEVKALDLKDKAGIGILFVMEGMKYAEKADEEGSLWVVLVDMKSKKVLLSERFVVEAKGFGFRNTWASTVKKVIEQINKKKYKEWKEKYGS